MDQKKVEVLSGAILIFLAAALLAYMRTQPWYTPHLPVMDDSSFFPEIVSWSIGAFGVFHLLYALRLPASGVSVSLNCKGLVLILIWLVYGFVLQPLGFLAASACGLFLSQLLWGERRMSVVVPVSVALPLVIYVILGKMLHVAFPQGIIPF